MRVEGGDEGGGVMEKLDIKLKHVAVAPAAEVRVFTKRIVCKISSSVRFA